MRNVNSNCSISEIDDYDLSKLLDRPRLNIERKRSFDEMSLGELSIGLSRALDHYDSASPGCSVLDTPVSSTRDSFEPHPMVAEAWDALRHTMVHFPGQPVGTIPAIDHASEEVLNYDQWFGLPDEWRARYSQELLVENTSASGMGKKRVDRFKLGEGVMPASFKVLHDPVHQTDTVVADFGESAIGRVAPVDSGFWWIILLRAYTKSTGDLSLSETPECQKGMRLILSL